MLEFPRWKYFLIVVVLALAVLYALPNAFPQDPSVQVNANRGAATGVALQQEVANKLQGAGLTAKEVEITPAGVIARMHDLDEQSKASEVLREGLGSDYVVALNLASTVPDWLASVGGKPMVLGLDLQGGVHFEMQVDQQAALDKRLDAYAEEIRASLRENRIGYNSVERTAGGVIVTQLQPNADADAAMRLLASEQPLLSRDRQGNRIVSRVPEAEMTRIAMDAIEQNITTLRNRIDEVGVAEPVIQRQGTDRVVVQLPGVQDTAEAKRMIGATATLEYRAVIENVDMEAVQRGIVPADGRVYYRRQLSPDDPRIPVVLSRRVIASGDQMVSAQSSVDENGMPAVNVTLDSAGGKRMFDFTSVSVGKPMAVVYIERIPEVRMVDGEEVRSYRVNEEVISVANIQGVFSRNFRTTGLERAEADGLARLLRSGSLAAPMDFVAESIIGPSLGAENVARGVTAVIYAFIFTLVFFTVYYRMFGVFTAIALLFNLVIVAAVMSIFGATMTLPGFAGLALSIGLSVDANVLINERIREELRNGMPGKAAIAAGYDKASTSIFDANVTGILAGVALYAFGTGPLRGFAITLVVGIIASMFTALTVTRAMATLWYGRRKKLKDVAV